MPKWFFLTLYARLFRLSNFMYELFCLYRGSYTSGHFIWIKKKKKSSFKSHENIHKKEDASYYVLSANKASSVTL